jgi:hypothetical protein
MTVTPPIDDELERADQRERVAVSCARMLERWRDLLDRLGSV